MWHCQRLPIETDRSFFVRAPLAPLLALATHL